jgi:hypothetical protein
LSFPPGAHDAIFLDRKLSKGHALEFVIYNKNLGNLYQHLFSRYEDGESVILMQKEKLYHIITMFRV